MVKDNIVTTQKGENYTCLQKIISLENKYGDIYSQFMGYKNQINAEIAAQNNRISTAVLREPFVIKCNSPLSMIGSSALNCTYDKNLTIAELIEYFNEGLIILNIGDENYLGYSTQVIVKPIEFVLNPVSFMWELHCYVPSYNASTSYYTPIRYVVIVSPNAIQDLSSTIATISIYKG